MKNRYISILVVATAVFSICSKCKKDEKEKVDPNAPYYIDINGVQEWSSRWIIGQNFKYPDNSSYISILAAKNTTENTTYGDEMYIAGVKGTGDYYVNLMDDNIENMDDLTMASFAVKGNKFYVSFQGSISVTSFSNNIITAKFYLKCYKCDSDFQPIDATVYLITGNINNLALTCPSMEVNGPSSFSILPYNIDAHFENTKNLSLTGMDADENYYVNLAVKNLAQKTYTINYAVNDIKSNNLNGDAFVGYAANPYYIGKTGNISISKIDNDVFNNQYVSGAFESTCINVNKIKNNNAEEYIDITGSFSKIMINSNTSNNVRSKVVSDKLIKQFKSRLKNFENKL